MNRSKKGRSKRRTLSGIEHLEERRLLKVYTITELEDDWGPGQSVPLTTLSGAINDLNGLKGESHFIRFDLEGDDTNTTIDVLGQLPTIEAPDVTISGFVFNRDPFLQDTRVILKGRNITGIQSLAYNGDSPAAPASNVGRFVVDGVKITDFDDAIQIVGMSSGDEVEIRNSVLYNNRGSGINALDGPRGIESDFDVFDTDIYSNAGDGIQLQGPSGGTTTAKSLNLDGVFVGTTDGIASLSNGGVAIRFGSGANDFSVGNSLFYDDTQSPVVFEGGAENNAVSFSTIVSLDQGEDAVLIRTGASSNTIVNSTIASNNGSGVALDPTAGIGNSVFKNTHVGAGAPVDLWNDGVINDPGDLDTGPNRSINRPLVDEAAIYNDGSRWVVPLIYEVNEVGEYQVDILEEASAGIWEPLVFDPQFGNPFIDNRFVEEPFLRNIRLPSQALVEGNRYAVSIRMIRGDSNATDPNTGSSSEYTVWTAIDNAKPAPALPGDYNQNNVVDAGDYGVWRDKHEDVIAPATSAIVAPYSVPDGNGDGSVTVADYVVWAENFLRTIGNAVTAEEALISAADFNGDGVINDSDYTVWLTALTTGVYNSTADPSGDGVNDAADLEVYLAGREEYELLYPPPALLTAPGPWVPGPDQLPRFVRGSDDAPLTDPTLPTQVTGVTLENSVAGGYYDLGALTGSGEQLRTVSVEGIDTISIVFSEETIPWRDALSVTNLDGSSPTGVLDFVYNVESLTATWVFDASFDDGRYVVRLDDQVIDLQGDSLDGDFLGPWSLSDVSASALPSGDGDAGGEFRFRFTVLAGDSDRDNIDGATDYTNWKSYEPGMIYVSTTVDDWDGNLSFGDVSLREAVDHANNAAVSTTVILPAGRYGLTRVGSEPTLGHDVSKNDLNITGDVQVLGDGPGVSVIDLENLYVNAHRRAFDIAGGGVLNLSGVTIANAEVHYNFKGAAAEVDSGGTLVLTDSAIVANKTNRQGVGIYSVGGDVTIRRSVFTNNKSTYKAGQAVYAIPDGAVGGSLTIGESVFAINWDRTPGHNDEFENSDPNVWVLPGVALTNEGNNLFDDATGGFFDTTPGVGDYLGVPDYVVSTVADTFDHVDDFESLSIREAIDLANQAAGQKEVWLPAWDFQLTRDRQTYGGGSSTDMDVTFGDLDIRDQLIIQGVTGRTRVEWKPGVVDSVFDLLGDANNDGLSVQDTNAADYTLWSNQNGSGSGTSADWEVYSADFDDDGDVDAADHAIWSSYYGNSLDLFDVAY